MHLLWVVFSTCQKSESRDEGPVKKLEGQERRIIIQCAKDSMYFSLFNMTCMLVLTLVEILFVNTLLMIYDTKSTERFALPLMLTAACCLFAWEWLLSLSCQVTWKSR